MKKTMNHHQALEQIPYLGNGLGFRSELKSFTFLNRDKISFVEIIADHYIDAPGSKMKELERLMANFTVIPHGIGLSLGTVSGLDESYLKKLGELIRCIDPPYWSEHIAHTRAHGSDIGHLAPIIYNNAFLNVLGANIGQVRQEIPYPLILENITYHVDLPGRDMSDAAFLNRLCELTGCGLLLDLTNLYINSRNMHFDPYVFFDQLELKHIVQLHYVGFEDSESQYTDTHARATQTEIFELMEYLFRKHMPKAVLLERDGRYEYPEEISDDIIKARELLKHVRS